MVQKKVYMDTKMLCRSIIMGKKLCLVRIVAEEQVKIFELIDKKNLYGRYKELTDLFKDNYSKDAIKNRLLEILK